jgi:uncharacterized membrane protein YcaP (DUF421 family)
MEIVLRTFTIYLFLLLIFRLTGKRTLSQLSTFDFILLLIISEATQNALIGEDYSVVTGMAVILTLVMTDLGLSLLKKKYDALDKITEGVSIVIVDRGTMLEDRMKKERIAQEDILRAARASQGLERIEQIKYAVLEPSGGISIIPMDPNMEEMLDRRIEAALIRLAREEPGVVP